jgi:hypothetical protein
MIRKTRFLRAKVTKVTKIEHKRVYHEARETAEKPEDEGYGNGLIDSIG